MGACQVGGGQEGGRGGQMEEMEQRECHRE